MKKVKDIENKSSINEQWFDIPAWEFSLSEWNLELLEWLMDLPEGKNIPIGCDK